MNREIHYKAIYNPMIIAESTGWSPFLILVFLVVAVFVALPTYSERQPSPFDTAVASWNMADVNDITPPNSALQCEENLCLGLPFEGGEKEESLLVGGNPIAPSSLSKVLITTSRWN